MTLSKYLIIQQIIMGAIMTLGCQLIFENTPAEFKSSRIHNSSRVIGLTATIIPLASFIYYFTKLQFCGAQYATAINLSAYCLSSTLLATAYYILLDKIDNKTIIKVHLAIGVIYPLPLWIGLHSGSNFIAKHTLIASYTLYVILAIIHSASCLYFYKQELLISRNTKLSEQRKAELELLGQTIYVSLGLILISICSPAFFTYPHWLGTIFVCAFTGGAIYIYMCYRRVSTKCISLLIKTYQNPNYPEMEEIEEEVLSNSSTTLSEETERSIERHLQQWLQTKEYLQSDISINYVAKVTYTNRTYLSKYVNSKYQCSFRVWITQLRVEEAKQLLHDNPKLSVADIATQVGFASTESFSHIFNRSEQISPLKWREESCKRELSNIKTSASEPR